MAWIDDRIWCHPKVADLSDSAFRVWVNGIAYAFGFYTRGTLSPGQQKLIGATAEISRELISAGLWEKNGAGIHIHDWDAHNGTAELRRERERERLRKLRATKHGTQSRTRTARSTDEG